MREVKNYKEEYKDLEIGDLCMDETTYQYHKVVFNDPEAKILRIGQFVNMDNLRKEIVKCFNKTAVGCHGCRCHEAQQGEKDLRRHIVALLEIFDPENENFNNLSHIEIVEI